MSIKLDSANLVDAKFLNIPYVLGKKDFSGSDCIGLCLLYLSEHGIDFKYDDKMGPVYEHWWEANPFRLMNAVSEYGKAIYYTSAKKFDLMLFFGEEQLNRFPMCMGVLVDDRHFLMALPDKGSFVQMFNKHWRGMLWGTIRLKKVVEAGLSVWE